MLYLLNDTDDIKLLMKIYHNNVINWTIYQGLKISSKTLISPNEYTKQNVAIPFTKIYS